MSSRSGGAFSQGGNSSGGKIPDPNQYPGGNGGNGNQNGYPGYGWGGGYGGYGGSGGGGSGGGVPDEIKDTFDYLGAVAGQGVQDLITNFNNAQDVYDNADEASRNSMLFQTVQNMRKQGAEWFHNLLNEQKVTKSLGEKIGTNYGTIWNQLMTDMGRQHDATGSKVIEALEENQGQINLEYAQALNNSINGSNELLLDTLKKIREGYSDYVTQGINLNKDLVNGEEDGYDKLVDTKKHKLKNPPEWLMPKDFWEKNFRKAVNVEPVKWTRPAAATESAWDKGLNRQESNTSSSANKRYWEALTDYSRRSK